MKSKYKVLHVDYNYTLKSEPTSVAQGFCQDLLVDSVDLRLVNDNGTILTYNFDTNPYVNVGDEIIINRCYNGRKCVVVENLTQKQLIADFIAKNKQK